MPLKKINQKLRQITYKIWDVEKIPYRVDDYTIYSFYRFYDFCSNFDPNDKWQIKLKVQYDDQGKLKFIFPDIYTTNKKAIHHSIVDLCRIRDDNYFYPIIREFRRRNSIKKRFSAGVFSFGFLENPLPASGLDSFTFRFRIRLITFLEDEPMFPPLTKSFINAPRPDVPDSIWELYDNRNVSGDLIIKVENKEFRAHKYILEQSCPALYQQINGKDGTLIITDFNPDIFSLILEYLYTGNVTGSDLDDNAELLLEASHRFELHKLKFLCEESLIYNYINYFNLSEAYDLAERCNAFRFSQRVLALIRNLNEGDRCWSPEKPSTGEELRKKYGFPFYDTSSGLKPCPEYISKRFE